MIVIICDYKSRQIIQKKLPGRLPLSILYSIVKVEGFLKGDYEMPNSKYRGFVEGQDCGISSASLTDPIIAVARQFADLGGCDEILIM